MAMVIDYPQSFSDLKQVHSYLYQMAEQLDLALNNLTADNFTKEMQAGIREIESRHKQTVQQGENLKALIVKTAGVVRSEMQVLEAKLSSDYVARSEFGTFTEELEGTIRATAEGVVQSYGYEAQLEALQEGMVSFQTFKTSTNQYIRTGLLYVDDNGVPRYGVAVGEKLTEIEQDGEMVLTRADLMSTFTSDKLSFWQNGVEIAYISNSVMHIESAEILHSLKIADFSFRRMLDGSLGLMYEED